MIVERETPTVSVIIPTYNSIKYLIVAIESVLNQTFKDYEILIIDDGSTDDTKESLAGFGDLITYIYQENAGVSAARNHGIKMARGKYVAFLDADDYWLPEKLEKQVAALENGSCKACYSSFTIGDEDLKPISVQYSRRLGKTLEDLLLYGGNTVGTPSTVIVETELVKKENFDPTLSHGADWEMWIRLATYTEFLYIEEPLIIYRTHESNMSKNAVLQEKDCIAVMEKGFALPNLPREIKNKERKAFAETYMVLAGNYFQAKMFSSFFRCVRNSLSLDFKKVSYLLRFPLRRLGLSKK